MNSKELKGENIRLKAEQEAMKVGFKPNCVEDVVLLVENIVKRDGMDVSTAIQNVAKKHPEMLSDDKKDNSFKVGAPEPDLREESTPDPFSKAFGLH